MQTGIRIRRKLLNGIQLARPSVSIHGFHKCLNGEIQIEILDAILAIVVVVLGNANINKL